MDADIFNRQDAKNTKGDEKILNHEVHEKHEAKNSERKVGIIINWKAASADLGLLNDSACANKLYNLSGYKARDSMGKPANQRMACVAAKLTHPARIGNWSEGHSFPVGV